MEKNSPISILGSSGMVGSAIERKLRSEGFTNIFGNRSKTCNLIHPHSLYGEWNGFDNHDYVYFSAARVGGIQANLDDPVGFGHDNMNQLTLHTHLVRLLASNYVKRITSNMGLILYHANHRTFLAQEITSIHRNLM